MPPLPITASLLTGIDAAAIEVAHRDAQLTRVRRRVHQTVGRSVHFSMSAEVGSPAEVIARAARERGAELVLVGLGAHGAATRASTEDMALQVARTADVPVLAVPPGYAVLPRRAVVAIDFANGSVRAARAAMRTLASGARLILAHVAPDVGYDEHADKGWRVVYREGVARLFDRLVRELDVPAHITADTMVLEGDPSVALLDLAVRVGADLVAAGSRSVARHDADPAGSVSAALLRGATCAALIAPPSPHRTPGRAHVAA